MKKIWQNLRLFICFTILTGLIYPLLITGIAFLTMKEKGAGSLIYLNEKPVGSKLIGQKFTQARYFWPRPSAIDYQPLPSGGSNLGPTSSALKQQVEDRKNKLLSDSSTKNNPDFPYELLFASGSGIDPHITLKAAKFQIERIAEARGVDRQKIEEMIDRLTDHKFLGFIGEEYVNVLLLNLALDQIGSAANHE